jgi:hypothetical protein
MRRAIAAAMNTLRQVAGVTVTYQRGAARVTLRATPARTEYDEVSAEGLVIRQQLRDYLVRASDLVLGGAATLPAEGDEILESDAQTGKTYTYRVLPVPSGETWRYADPHRQELRIHTKLRTIA